MSWTLRRSPAIKPPQAPDKKKLTSDVRGCQTTRKNLLKAQETHRQSGLWGTDR